MIKFQNTVILIAIVLLSFACAQKGGVLSGGPKDTQSPKILAATPNNFQLQVKGNELHFEFDEYVVLRNLNAQFFSSPTLEIKKQTLNGKSLHITFKDSFAANTTYQINFGNAIVDLNEGNVLDSAIWVFSTGMQLDSMQLTGKIIDAYTLEPQKDFLVCILSDTTGFYDKKPQFAVKASEKGEFALKYLPTTNAFIYAFNDANNNLKIDATEHIAFLKEFINTKTPSDSSTFTLYSFNPALDSIYIAEKKIISPVYFKLAFNKPVLNYSITPLNYGVSSKRSLISSQLNSAHDSLYIYLPEPANQPNISLLLSYDSIKSDTLTFSLANLEAPKDSSSFNYKLNTQKGVLNYLDTLQLQFSQPIKSILNDSIQLLSADSQLVETQAILGKNNTVLFLVGPIRPTESYLLRTPAATFKNALGLYNDSTAMKFKVNEAANFGSIRIKIDSILPTTHKVLTLTNEAKKIERVIHLSPTDTAISITPVLSGKYNLKVLFDANNNGRFDVGNIEQSRLPEQINYYNNQIEVRGGWESELIVK